MMNSPGDSGSCTSNEASPEVVAPSMRSPLRQSKYDFNKLAREDGLFIGISGMIGAGKSTLAEALAKELGLPVWYEPVKDNVYLESFYTDMEKYSFPMQVYLLNKRFKQQQQIIWQSKGGVQDRTIYEDSVFARMLRDQGFMSQRDYDTYSELFSCMSNFMKRPNLIVHLDVSPEESLRRINMRDRACERDIPLSYLEGLHAAYNSFIEDIARVIPVIKVDYSRFRDPKEMARMISAEYESIANVREVGLDAPSWGSDAAAAGGSKGGLKTFPDTTSGLEGEGRMPQPDFNE